MKKLASLILITSFVAPIAFAQTPEQEEQQLRQDAQNTLQQGYDYFVEGALEKPVEKPTKKSARVPASVASNGKYFKEGSQPDEALSAELVLDLLGK
jgi:hypothetical protein